MPCNKLRINVNNIPDRVSAILLVNYSLVKAKIVGNQIKQTKFREILCHAGVNHGNRHLDLNILHDVTVNNRREGYYIYCMTSGL